ncbi:hypothetical protein [Roseospirillum parvum]|nr:hypothetical protein [Roseospirillum parvum]
MTALAATAEHDRRDVVGAMALCGPALSVEFKDLARHGLMNRTFLLVVIVALAVVAAVAGYLYYQERQSGVDIKIDGSGVTIDSN